MRKLIAAFTTGIIVLFTTAVTVSAEEYEVQVGDSLWQIANENNTSVDELKDINDLKTMVIHPKQILLINEKYTVKHGDSLSSIADSYDVTVEDLMKWNDLESNHIIIGQDLVIKGKDAVQVNNTEESKSTEKSEKTQSNNETKTEKANKETSDGKTMTVSATAYTASCEGCSGVTYTGVDLNKDPNAKVIAVDPNVIPLGSEVYVEGYGYATAADIGSAIKGNKIDVFIPNQNEAKNWGTKTIEITILD